MKTISIGFSKDKSKSFVSDAIRWVLKSQFSHTYLEFQAQDLHCKTIFQAVDSSGVSYQSEVNFLKNNTVVDSFQFTISNQLYIKILNLCHDHAGLRYGYLQNVGIAFVKLLKWCGIKYTRNPLPYGMNCSEWCGYILQELYGTNWIDKEPNLIDPVDVYNFLKKKQAESGKNAISP